MSLRQGLTVLCSVGLIASTSHAVAVLDINQAVSQIQADSTLLSGWMTDQLKFAVPFNSTAGNVVPSQLKIFGFEAGIEGVASGTHLDVPALRSLPTSVVNTQQIDTFSRLPMPSALLHAKIGLPFGLDAGVRVGGIPKESFNNGSTHISVKNSIVGIDLRKKIIEEGAMKPFGLTVDANFTRASGSLDETSPYSSNGTANVNGTTYDSTLSATGAGHSQWDTKSFGVQAILDKQILFITPYIGASANRNFGSLSTDITTNGTETLTNPNNSFDTASQTFSTLGSGSSSPNKWDCRALAGVEFSILPFVRLGLQGEYAGNKNVAGALGLRIQFR